MGVRFSVVDGVAPVLVGIAALAAASPTAATAAPALKTLVSFDGSVAAFPDGNLFLDAAGNLLGTTRGGGKYGAGTVFEIVKTGASTYATKPTILVSFDSTSTDGKFPTGGLIADAHGNLYGTTTQGGRYGFGAVFKIAKTSTGYASTATILASFSFASGQNPGNTLVADRLGNLFGATPRGGLSTCGLSAGCGTVFEIVRTSTGYASTPKALVRFDGADGQAPQGGLIFDAKGAILGTTSSNGGTVGGTLFEIPKTATGYAAKPVTLAQFGGGGGVDGAFPHCTLVTDSNGNVFGTTGQGGAHVDGAVFELKKTTTGYDVGATLLASFATAQGDFPESGLIIDAHGNLFGAAQGGGGSNHGTVFKLSKTAAGYSTTPTVLVSFNNANGALPLGRVVADGAGHLFGTTDSGGRFGFGTVYEITGAGFFTP